MRSVKRRSGTDTTVGNVVYEGNLSTFVTTTAMVSARNLTGSLLNTATYNGIGGCMRLEPLRVDTKGLHTRKPTCPS